MSLTKTDFEQFKNWLDLDINSIAWEGRYKESFSGFWDSFFKDQIGHLELSERFDYAKKIAKSGPLISWINWLFEKFIAFSFINQGKSVREIAFLFDLPEKYVSTVLRDHLIKVYPAYEDFINENFQISNVSSKNLFLKFEDLVHVPPSEARTKGTFDDDILAHMEVTLYPDWPHLVKELRKDILSLKVDFENFKKKTSFKKQLRFVQEVIFLLLILTVVVLLLKIPTSGMKSIL